MSVWAITMVKDEADVIEDVIRHVAAQGVTGIIAADNGSTDGTLEILQGLHRELDCDLTVKHDDEPGYYQSAKMTKLAEEAHASGAEWVWPFDADELWYYGDTQTLAQQVTYEGIMATGADVLQARLWHHMVTGVDTPAASPFKSMQYRLPDEAPIGKVIVRWQPGSRIEQGNHAATMTGGRPPVIQHTDIQVRHFPYRSSDQFVRKAINGSQAYAATDLPWSAGQHWREYGVHYERGGENALRGIWKDHFYYDLPSASGLVHDPARLDA